MPHQNTESPTATAQNAVNEPGNDANRPHRTEVMSGQGPKTRAANARIVKGRRAG